MHHHVVTYLPQDGTSPYFGALVGRVANRIAGATFELDGETYHVSANENTTSLHGGKVGFSQRLWKGHVFTEGEDSGVMLRYESPDDEEVCIHLPVHLQYAKDCIKMPSLKTFHKLPCILLALPPLQLMLDHSCCTITKLSGILQWTAQTATIASQQSLCDYLSFIIV